MTRSGILGGLLGRFLFSLGLLLLWSAVAAGQGVLVVINPPHPTPLPRPIPPPQPAPMSYKIKELAVQANIQDQVARVQVSQSFVNTGSRQMEVAFVFPLPYDGAVDRMTFMIDGKEYDAKLLDAKEARSIYENYVRQNQDPALLEWIGTGMFKTSVFPVPPGAERKVSLRYNQLLRKDRGLTDFLFPLSTAKYTSQPVESISIQASIESASDIKNVYSPTHPIDITRPDGKHAVIKFEAKNQAPATDFRLFFDAGAGELAASVLSYRHDKSDEGYFLLLASPQIQSSGDERPKKTVIFVVDRSGSMSGKKMEQTKEALKFVVNNLREGDLFNIVAYDSVVESFRPELQGFNEETRKAAIGFADGLYAGGSTNINDALSTAMAMIQDDSRPNFVVFLTDGQPTAGETNESKIVADAEQKNKLRARMISFGVGYDVNSRLLDRLSRTNYGQSEYVRPDENIEAHVSRLASKFSAPVLTSVNVDIQFDGPASEGAAVNRIYPKKVYDLFAGEQLVVVGRYKKFGAAKVVISGKTPQGEQKFDFPAQFTESSPDQSYAFVEKLWAVRRIGEIIDELDLSGRNEELIKELIALSTKHGVLTPYTSFLADENAKPTQLADANRSYGFALDRLERLSEAEGVAGFAQRAEKKMLQEARTAPLASGLGGADASAPAGPGGSAPGAARAAGRVAFRDIDSDKEVAVDAVRIAGGEAIYARGKVWFAASAADVDLERDAKDVQSIKSFSPEYFKLVADNTPTENAVLARQQPGEELIIKLRGKVYRIY